MNSSTKTWISRVFMTLLVISLLACGYGLYHFDTERKNLKTEVAALNNRAALLEKKYGEQKAMTEAMLRAKQAVESQARDAEFKLSEQEKRNGELETALAESAEKIARINTSYEETIKTQKERFASLRDSYDKLREESNTIIRKKNQEITRLTHERDALSASLNQETFQHKRCREHNSRLAVLTDELVEQYRNKGFLGGTPEPFTQLKKVEMEKICQEYRDRIDDETL